MNNECFFGGIMQKKYRGLRFIGLLLKIIGVGELIIGFASILLFPLILSDPNMILFQFVENGLLPGSGLLIGIIAGVFLFLVGLVFGLLTFSAGELFNIFIAIEENTRASLTLLQNSPMESKK